MTTYENFLASKEPPAPTYGREPDAIHPMLYDFQQAIVRWAVKRGRAAIFADCGLGKTLMQLEWARMSGDRCLIVTPLAVAEQTIREAEKIGLSVRKVTQPEPEPGIQVVNYQKLHHFLGAEYDAIVLDESSILKSLDGKTRRLLIREFTHIPRRLCCTATPAPNDIAELANHSEFLGIMPRQEMLAMFFVHDSDGKAAGGWRLKGHAQEAFWKWMSHWALYLRGPEDLGFEPNGFRLPPLEIVQHVVQSGWRPDGMLFAAGLGGIGDRRRVRSGTIDDRVRESLGIMKGKGQWLVWCALNAEARAITAALGDDAVNIEGADSDDEKIRKELEWREGRVRALVTKPSIFGFGMNWQHCANVLFLGIGDSYEQYYQAIRRCWRFGQERPVLACVVVSEAETEVLENVKRKEEQAKEIASGIIEHAADSMRAEISGAESAGEEYAEDHASGFGWDLWRGDCVESIRKVETGSVGLSVFSPPFASLYTYSASPRDLGNSRSYEEFFEHFRFLIPELLRITMPGRRCAVHVQQVTTTMVTHGEIGWRDFRADVVREFKAAGWVYDGEVVIDKDPQAQAIRTKSKSLMFIQKKRDAAWLRPAMADYILCFRHPDDNLVPVVSDVSNEEWILWARPIWYGIRESDTLQFRSAREDKDERHIAPLQLETIERCIRLWTNPGETVFSPFAGIGSEGFVAISKLRKFIGIELKESYFRQAAANLRAAQKQGMLFE